MRQATLFYAGGRDFTCSQVLSAAEFRGELEPIRDTLRGGLACLSYAEDEGFEPDTEDLQEASSAYRYENDLTTAEETEAWLQEHDLTLEDFTAFFERRYWLERFGAELGKILPEYQPSSEEIAHLLWPEIVLGQHLTGLTHALGWRVAASLETAGEVPTGSSAEEWAIIETRFQDQVQRILTLENCQRELQARGLVLMRFEVVHAAFTSAQLAQEAFLCVTQDGEELETVTERAGVALERYTGFVESFSDELQPRIISAAPGETLPPLATPGGYQICRLQKKIEPHLDIPEVRQRIKELLLNAAFDELVRKHVVWIRPPRGSS
jgi:hypothetical protein